MNKIDKSWYLKPKDINFPTKTNSGGLVIRKNSSEFLIALIRDRGSDGYALPKGGVEDGENLIDAAVREVEEETGLTKLSFVADMGHKTRLTFKKDVWVTTHYYLFTTDQISGIQKLQEDEDFEVEWFDINKLPNMFWPEQKDMIKENLSLITSYLQKPE